MTIFIVSHFLVYLYHLVTVAILPFPFTRKVLETCTLSSVVAIVLVYRLDIETSPAMSRHSRADKRLQTPPKTCK